MPQCHSFAVSSHTHSQMKKKELKHTHSDTPTLSLSHTDDVSESSSDRVLKCFFKAKEKGSDTHTLAL